MFIIVIEPVMEDAGWEITRQKRLGSPKTDWMFVPPGVNRYASNTRVRLNYFDSFSQLWRYLRQKKHDDLARRCLELHEDIAIHILDGNIVHT